MEANPKRAKKSKDGDTCFWTTSMDEVLIDAYLHQQTLGNKNGNCMSSSALDNILQELRDHFPDKPISKDKIKDHMKHIKWKFNVCYGIFKNGLSGFAWDATTNMWIAKPEMWDRLIEAKPEAAKWRHKAFMHYDKLAQLFGSDWASGENAETAAEILARRASSDGKGHEHDNIMGDIDRLFSPAEVTLEGFDMVDEELQPYASPKGNSDGHSHNAVLSKTMKHGKKVVEDETSISQIAKSIDKMAEVFVNLSKSIIAELDKQNKSAASEAEIWAQLEDMGVEPALLPNVYLHLVQHPVAMKAFNGIPVHRRKELLHRIVPGYPPCI